MTLSNLLLLTSVILMVIGFGSFIYHVYFSKLFFTKKEPRTIDRASAFGDFISGITGPIFALSGFLIVYSTIIENRQDSNEQKFENIVFKFIDYQRENLKSIVVTWPADCGDAVGVAVWGPLKGNLRTAYKFVDTSKYTKHFDTSIKKKISYPLFYYGTPNNTKRYYRSIPFIKKFVKNKNDLDSFIAQALRIYHCADIHDRFPGYSGQLEPIYKQFINYITYVDNSDVINFEKKKQYIKVFTDNHTARCMAMLYLHYTSELESPESIELLNKYDVFGKTDPKLLQYAEY